VRGVIADGEGPVAGLEVRSAGTTHAGADAARSSSDGSFCLDAIPSSTVLLIGTRFAEPTTREITFAPVGDVGITAATCGDSPEACLDVGTIELFEDNPMFPGPSVLLHQQVTSR
jgi:hypothetical protein